MAKWNTGQTLGFVKTLGGSMGRKDNVSCPRAFPQRQLSPSVSLVALPWAEVLSQTADHYGVEPATFATKHSQELSRDVAA